MTARPRDETCAPNPLDAVGLAVLTNRFASIVRKMQNTLLRTARSGVVNMARDFSCCILTGNAELLAIGESLPSQVVSGADLMAKSMKDFHPTLRRGDAFLHNSPYHGNNHPADLTVLAPVLDEAGVHRFTVAAKAHQADIGNSVPTTYFAEARDVYEEGALIFPAVKVQEDYRDRDDIIRICRLRIRVPEQWWGDHLASLGAVRIGESELCTLAAEVGWETLETYARLWFDYSERRMIAALGRLPGGRVSATSVHDPFPSVPDGVPVTVAVTVNADNGLVEVDLRDNPDCLPCGLNLSEASARTAATIGIMNCIDAAVPANAGSFRRIHVQLRENCALGIPRHPASCSCATTNLAERVTNAVQLAIAELGDGFGMAEAGAIMTPANAVISGRDPRFGDAPFVNELMLGDTVGAATPTTDGWLTLAGIGAAGLCFWDSVEVDEVRHPIRIAARHIIPDSEGAGRYRGAPASHVEYGPVASALTVAYMSDGTVNGPRGARGGLAGAAARQYRRLRSGKLVDAPACGMVDLAPGETVVAMSCGGGGYGAPHRREPEQVKRDVQEGWITKARAREVYRVVLDDVGEVDAAATAALRGQASACPSRSQD